MSYPKLNIAIAALTVLSGFAAGAVERAPDDQYPVSIAHPDELFMQDMARHMIHSLPVDQQRVIAAKGGIGSDAVDLSGFTFDRSGRDLQNIPQGITAQEYLDSLLSADFIARLGEEQIRVVKHIASLIDQGTEMPAMCFAPGTDPEYAFLIDQMLDYQFVSDKDSSRFQEGPRWSRTATDGGNLAMGQPTTLTYSFAPDGSFVPDAGLGSGNSATFQWLNGLYGSPAVWQPLFHQIFQRWEDLVGTTYVFEQNDDGANMSSRTGVLGVRGDVRIFAFDYPLDGNFGVLAYNFFPNNGDMAIDAFDAFYDETSGNSLRFRNVVAHEHGHGLGMAHVCPANQTKLMEPFVSTAYDGPQLDDVLNGIRNYGDNQEPNDNIGGATDLGTLLVGGSTTMDNIGLDGSTDQDYFRVSLVKRAAITFTVSPDAAAYDQGPQTSDCTTGIFTDYNSIQDLQISVLDSAGNTLASSNTNGLGLPESITFTGATPGDYYFVIDGADDVDNVQRYKIDANAADAPFLNPLIQLDAPNSIDPGVSTAIDLIINPQEDTLVEGTQKLFYSINGGGFTSTNLISNGGLNYTAILPPVNCADLLGFYISVEGVVAGEITFPTQGADLPIIPVVGTIIDTFADNFENDLGWTISGNISSPSAGQWERGAPAGLGTRGDPLVDADGSGSAYLTGNAPGNTDVDGGQTILTSPLFAMSNNPNARLMYSRWYDNTGGGNGTAPGEDVFTVEISNNNGASWTTVETVGPSTPESSGGWFAVDVRVANFVIPTDQVLVRFIAEDIGEGSVVEAAVDDIHITGQLCEDPKVSCIADFTGDGMLNFFDVSAFLVGFSGHDPISDLNGDGLYNFFDVSAFLVAFSEGCP